MQPHTFYKAIQEENIQLIKEHLSVETFDPTFSNNISLETACELENIEIITLLVEDVRIKIDSRYYSFMEELCVNEKIDILKIFLKHKDINQYSRYNNRLFQTSIIKNAYKSVEFLLNELNVEPNVCANHAMFLANEYNFVDIIELLWKQKSVRNTLSRDNNALYNILKKEEVKEKIIEFT